MKTSNSTENRQNHKRRLPEWLRRPLPAGEKYNKVQSLLKELRLNTVCRSAMCPNLGQCWSSGTATFMIMGKYCTRMCKFCAVDKGIPEQLEDDEPERIAIAVREMKLKHVVVTSVTRDDLPDEGANHFANTITAIRQQMPQTSIEVLTPDFHNRSDCLDAICHAGPTIFNHNIETVRELSKKIRPQADYERSLAVLEYVRRAFPDIYVKSGLMVGLGETDNQIKNALKDLTSVGCQIVTIGQYLAPSKMHYPIHRFMPPERFKELANWAREHCDFLACFAGPFVRSSYLASNLLEEINAKMTNPNGTISYA